MWVRLRYGARDADGEPVEDLEPELSYVHGYGALLPQLEAALEGHRASELVRGATLPPQEAFGRRREEQYRASREDFPEDVRRAIASRSNRPKAASRAARPGGEGPARRWWSMRTTR